jgi:hypothetical protein
MRIRKFWKEGCKSGYSGKKGADPDVLERRMRIRMFWKEGCGSGGSVQQNLDPDKNRPNPEHWAKVHFNKYRYLLTLPIT